MIPDETVSLIGIYRCNILKLTETELINVMKHTSLYLLANQEANYHQQIGVMFTMKEIQNSLPLYKVHWVFIYFQTTMTFPALFLCKIKTLKQMYLIQ